MSGLDRVYWIGGCPCAGKTTIARRLASRFQLDLYCLDDRFGAHLKAAPPTMRRFRALANRPLDRLFLSAPERQAADLWAFYDEQMRLVVQDLAAAQAPVIAEGAGWLPSWIAGLGALDRAVWLMVDEPRRRWVYGQRRQVVEQTLAGYDDATAAFESWVTRDELFADRLRQEAERVGGGNRVLWIEGSTEVDRAVGYLAKVLGLAPSGDG